MRSQWLWLVSAMALTACTTSPPRQTADACGIFEEKRSWYQAARKAEQRWGSPVATMMAMMHRESRFRAKAKPPRTRILWVIPGPRKSDAYGYAQAKDSTWDWYRKSTGNRGADRDDFEDAMDFIGWYNDQTRRRNRVAVNDTYHLYLAYHEGHGGFSRKTYNNKPWLLTVARQVANQALLYQQQLQTCEQRLQKKRFSLWPF